MLSYKSATNEATRFSFKLYKLDVLNDTRVGDVDTCCAQEVVPDIFLDNAELFCFDQCTVAILWYENPRVLCGLVHSTSRIYLLKITGHYSMNAVFNGTENICCNYKLFRIITVWSFYI